MGETAGGDFLGQIKRIYGLAKDGLQRTLEQKIPVEEIDVYTTARIIRNRVLNPFNPTNEFSIVSVLTALGYSPDLADDEENLNSRHPRAYPKTRVALLDLTREHALKMQERTEVDSEGETMYYTVDDPRRLKDLAETKRPSRK